MIRADEGSTFTMSGAKDVQARMTTDQAPIQNNQKPAFVADGMLIVLILAFANFLLHLYFNNRYGYFRDEFDYMSCGDHLGWGYVDQPPLIPFLIHVCRALLGDSLRSIRFIPALASSLLIVQTAAIARELGGAPLRPRPQRRLRAHRTAISIQRQPVGDQLSRTQLVDGLRLLRHPGHQAK